MTKIPVWKHFVFMLAFAGLALNTVGFGISLIIYAHRSMGFAIGWTMGLALAPLYIISSWISQQLDKAEKGN